MTGLKMKTFKLEIRLGNDAMQTAADIAEALERVAVGDIHGGSGSGLIFDYNGNSVGVWSLY